MIDTNEMMKAFITTIIVIAIGGFLIGGCTVAVSTYLWNNYEVSVKRSEVEQGK